MAEEYSITDYYKRDGVRDIKPLKARGLFAKALIAEDRAGETTPEALELLDEAVKAETGE